MGSMRNLQSECRKSIQEANHGSVGSTNDRATDSQFLMIPLLKQLLTKRNNNSLQRESPLFQVNRCPASSFPMRADLKLLPISLPHIKPSLPQSTSDQSFESACL
ncbi:hypothetical protein Q8A73_022245 [Channa argus]|nr:hypothetical protein Q8A73_022245 [Channa argus]